MKRLQVSETSSSRLRSLGISLLLISAAGLVVGIGWLSVQFFLDPKSVAWMNQYLPANAKIPYSTWDDPKTLTEIQGDLRKAGLTAGSPIEVQTGPQSDKKPNKDVLIPVFRRQQDSSQPNQLVELRAYRTVLNPTRDEQEALQFVNTLNVKPLDDGFVLQPLANAKVTSPGSDRELPPTKIDKFDNPLPRGVWLNLHGTLEQGDATIAYGQIVYYDPTTSFLESLLNWTSPNGELPTWRKRPGKTRPLELVVDQSVGLEPDFQTFQLRNRKAKSSPFQFEAVSLEKPGIENAVFSEALFLARNGLWSPALAMMRSVRKQTPDGDWTITAQAQVDLVADHAKITSAEAERPSANVSQQILAYLIDGRWAKATEIAQVSVADREEILELLKFESGRIQKRINAALQLNPYRADVQTWAALRIAAKQSKSHAIAWLKQQSHESSGDRPQILKLLNQIDDTAIVNETAQPRASQKQAVTPKN